MQRALIQNVDGRWEMFSGGRGVIAASVFYKYFDKPIERVVIAAANPIATFQNSDHAQNFGIELEAGHQLGRHLFVNANYTFVDSKITLLPEQRTVQTSLERPLAGQSKNLFNLTGEFATAGLLGPAALQLLRRPHLGRRRQRGAGHHRAGTRRAGPGVRAAYPRPRRPAHVREPDQQRLPVHADADGRRDAAALQDRAAPSRCRSATTCSEAHHDEYQGAHEASCSCHAIAVAGSPLAAAPVGSAVTSALVGSGAAGQCPGHRQAGDRGHRRVTGTETWVNTQLLRAARRGLRPRRGAR